MSKKFIVRIIPVILMTAFLALGIMFSGCRSDSYTDVSVVTETGSGHEKKVIPQLESHLPELAAGLGNTNTVLNILLDNISDDTAQKFILYISGIDVWGEQEIVSRSDVNLLLSVNRTSGKIQMVNTPRDSYVLLPNSGDMRDKLTHAGLYGTDCSKRTLENLYGIQIDYCLRTNFSGFEKFIDALGGIDVYSEQDFTVEPIKHYVKGMNHLTGLESLAFVRERKSFADGDYQRGRHQMEMAKAVVKAMSDAKTLANFSQYLKDIYGYYQTDIPDDLIRSIALTELVKQTDWDIETYTTRGSGSYEPTFSVPSQSLYVTILNEEDVKEGGELLNKNIDR